MSGSVGNASKVIAGILAVMLVFLMPLGLLAWDLGRVVFSRPLVKSILVDEVVNSALIPAALEGFSKGNGVGADELGLANEPVAAALMGQLDREDWRAIMDEVLPPAILTEWVSATVDGVYGWLGGSEPAPQITWDMKSFKERLNTENGVNAILIAYENMEPCTGSQLADFAARLAAEPAGTKIPYFTCRFPGVYEGRQVVWYTEQFEGYKNALGMVVQKVPDQLDLSKAVGLTQTGAQAELQGVWRGLKTVRGVMILSSLLIIGLLVVILLLAVRSPEDLARWWGIPLLVGGALTLVTGLIYRGAVSRWLDAAFTPRLPSIIDEAGLRILYRLADAAYRAMIFQAFVLLLTGIGLLVWLGVRSRRLTGSTTQPATAGG